MSLRGGSLAHLPDWANRGYGSTHYARFHLTLIGHIGLGARDAARLFPRGEARRLAVCRRRAAPAGWLHGRCGVERCGDRKSATDEAAGMRAARGWAVDVAYLSPSP